MGFQYPASRSKTARALEMVGRGGRWNNFEVSQPVNNSPCIKHITFRVPVVSSSMQSKKITQPSTTAFYNIKANWKKFGAYLNGTAHHCNAKWVIYICLDMGSLILDVGLGDVSNEAMLIGQTVVKHMGRLSVNTPIEE